MIFLLSNAATDKMPETAGATVIYICVALIGLFVTCMITMFAWWGRHISRLDQRAADERILFDKQSAEQRKAHENEQRAERDAHREIVEKINESHQRVIDRTYASFEKSMAKLSMLAEPPGKR